MRPHHIAGFVGIALALTTLAVCAWSFNGFGQGPLAPISVWLMVCCILAIIIAFALMVGALTIEAAHRTENDG